MITALAFHGLLLLGLLLTTVNSTTLFCIWIDDYLSNSTNITE